MKSLAYGYRMLVVVVTIHRVRKKSTISRHNFDTLRHTFIMFDVNYTDTLAY